MRHFIASCTRIVAEQEAEVRQLHTNLNLVQECGHKITSEDFALAWSTKQWPKRVQKLAENCKLVLENDKIRMMNKLALEKEAFEADLEAYETRVDEFKKLKTTPTRKSTNYSPITCRMLGSMLKRRQKTSTREKRCLSSLRWSTHN